MSWGALLWLCVAGSLGTLARFAVATLLPRSGPSFPWATLAVNAAGSFLFGLLITLGEERRYLSPETRLILLTGFLGAFTTFSTFAFETADLLRRDAWGLALANLLVQNTAGVLLALAGVVLGRRVA